MTPTLVEGAAPCEFCGLPSFEDLYDADTNALLYEGTCDCWSDMVEIPKRILTNLQMQLLSDQTLDYAAAHKIYCALSRVIHFGEPPNL